MRIADPQPFIDAIDTMRWDSLKGRGSLRQVQGVEPRFIDPAPPIAQEASMDNDQSTTEADKISETPGRHDETGAEQDQVIRGRIQRLGDFVDTDAVSIICNLFLAR